MVDVGVDVVVRTRGDVRRVGVDVRRVGECVMMVGGGDDVGDGGI